LNDKISAKDLNNNHIIDEDCDDHGLGHDILGESKKHVIGSQRDKLLN
jgi:hypothetical protein